MTDILTFPTGPLAEASLSITQRSESTAIAAHSIRSFLYARILAMHEGVARDAAYREDLLFAACVMHDLGLGAHAAGQARFEVEGADLAATVMTGHGATAAEVDQVWEAIALHSSPGIADRRGPLTYLTYKGVFMDTGRFTDGLDEALLRQVRATYPRPADDHSVRDAIVEHAARSEAAAPPFSIAAELVRQRRAAVPA
jgi:hypothetical protein